MYAQKIKLAIIDEAPILSYGLVKVLQENKDVQIVTAAATTDELFHKMSQQPADILLVDILRYTKGDKLGKKVKAKFPLTKILVLSMNKHDKKIVPFLLKDPDIDGYLSDRAGSRELQKALKKMIEEGGYFSTDISRNTYKIKPRKKSNIIGNLTERELDIIRLINREYNNRQIADALDISERTVETHRKHIYQKTATNNIVGLIKYIYVHKLAD